MKNLTSTYRPTRATTNADGTPRKGLACSVLRNADGRDCSRSGISSKCQQVVLCGPGIPEMTEPTADRPLVEYEIMNTVDNWGMRDGGLYIRAQVCGTESQGMAGGAFIYTSDSRFPWPYPISLHDRFES